jgi:hypothetical protein
MAGLSFVERAVLEAVAKCPTGQMRCLLKKARKYAPKWGIDRNDIVWGIKRLRASGMLKITGHGGQGAIFYRMANGVSAKKRLARLLKGPGPREARRLLRRYYKRRNPKRAGSYQIRHQKRIWREIKRLKLQHRKDRLLGLSLRKKGYNMRKRRRNHHAFYKTHGRFQEETRKIIKKRRRIWRKRRLSLKRSLKMCRNARPQRTSYKWFVKHYGVKYGAKYYREAKRKRYY